MLTDIRTDTPNRTTDTTHASTHHPLTAKWGGAEVTKALLEAGAAVAQSTTLGVQPLHMAAQEGQVGVARLLLEHGAPAGATDRAGWSAFHYAANHRWATWRGDVSGQLEVLELLRHTAQTSTRATAKGTRARTQRRSRASARFCVC